MVNDECLEELGWKPSQPFRQSGVTEKILQNDHEHDIIVHGSEAKKYQQSNNNKSEAQ